MIFAQIDEAAKVATNWLNEGVAIGLIMAGVSLATYFFIWVWIPYFKKRQDQTMADDHAAHEKDMELKTQLIANVADQTKTLKNVQESMTAHTALCREQSVGECAKLEYIKEQVGNHTDFLVDLVDAAQAGLRKYRPDIIDEMNLDQVLNNAKNKLLGR